MSTSTETNSQQQITDYPKGARVVAVGPIAAYLGDIPTGTKGTVTGHCDDGRAWVFFDGHSEGHTFHHPQGYIRVIEAAPSDAVQSLAHQLESQASTLARVAEERDRLRETVLKLGHQAADGSGTCWCAADDRVFGHTQRCRSIRGVVNLTTTTTTGQEEG